LHCTFAQLVWSEVESWTQLMVGKPGPGLLISDWWEKELVQLSKKARRVKAAVMIYTAWNIWKERNQRVFDQKSITTFRGVANDQE